MIKVFRLHETSTSEAKEGWFKSDQIGRTEIDTIPDPEGARTEHLAVALPTPFARMHLVKTALAFVSSPANRNQSDSVHHRLVGQFWDLWELVFNYHQRSQSGPHLEIWTWNCAEEMVSLEEKEDTRLLAQALRLYLNDKEFDSLKELHLVYLITPDTQPRSVDDKSSSAKRTLVGGTSPITLLFPAPDLQPLPLKRPQGGGYYFDNNYVALEEREAAFRNFIYQQFVKDQDLARLAPAVSAALNQEKLRGWRLDGNAQLDDYSTLKDKKGNPVAVAITTKRYADGKPETVAAVEVRIRRLAQPGETTVHTSDFTVRPTRPQNILPTGALPLMLRPGLKAPGVIFNNTPLGDIGATVPEEDPRPLNERTLPGVELRHPYLTTGDLLEDTLLTVPYEVDGDKFATGRVVIAPGYKPNCWPLLAVKPCYFDYFTAANLATQLEVTLFLDERGLDSVKVQLTIPVGKGGRNDVVVYERIYTTGPTEAQKPLLVTNVGLSIFPFIRIADKPEYNDFYKVMLVDGNTLDKNLVNESIKLRFGVTIRPDKTGQGNVPRNFLSDTGTTPTVNFYNRTPKTRSFEGSTYYEVRGTDFDYFEVRSPNPAEGCGLVVPLWPEVVQGVRNFRFAIDFGTTNTHVAYRDADGQDPQSLTFGLHDTPVALLKKPSEVTGYTTYEQLLRGIYRDVDQDIRLDSWQLYQKREFLPPLLGSDESPYRFPIRTATSEALNFERSPAQLLSNINIGFGINTEDVPNDSYRTNLKWSDSVNNRVAESRISAFFREMLLLFRCKAARNGGNLSATQVVWFAPLSFSDRNLDSYKTLWNSLFREIFHIDAAAVGAARTRYLPESSAPYFYLSQLNDFALGASENVAFVDIGGGTSDILFYAADTTKAGQRQQHRPVFSTSFRFAGNDLWGDGATRLGHPKDNGLVRFGLDKIHSEQEQGRLPASILEAHQCLKVAENNREFGSEDIASLLFHYGELGFFRTLEGANHLRILFYLHFGAIVYHLGQVAKLHGQKMPRYLYFTGRGSLYFPLLSSPERLQDIAKLILAKTMNQAAPDNFRIPLVPNPKEATANGGVVADAENVDADEIPRVQAIGTGAETPEELLHLHPGDTEKVRQAVLDNVGHCLDFLLKDPEMLVLYNKLDIQSDRHTVLTLLKGYLPDSFNITCQRYASTLRETETIPETLFFLPLKHALYELSRELYKAGPVQ